MANTMTRPLDKTSFDEKDIVVFFIQQFLINHKHGQMSYDYYCGITNDIESNLSRHGVSGYTACVACGSFEIAAKVEEHLYHLGFDIGNPKNKAGNGGSDDSTIVYMIEKDDDFKQ